MPVIACVPNISEGRRADVLQMMSEEVASVRGVRLLDVSSDAEQNRSVFTFVGTQTPLRRAVYRLMRVAFDKLDISKHRGKHPRVGIVDVVPFIPLRDTTMERCIRLSRTVGEELADRFGVPVYLYEQSASAPHRVSVNDIRSGEYESFAQKMTLPEWKPDFGPNRVHPTAGVVIVGARQPIVTFLISLQGADVQSAARLAAAIRAVGARPRQVKALVLPNGDDEEMKIAVSLFDYKATPMHVVIEAAKKAARKESVNIVRVRLVGLVTAGALLKSLEYYMQIENFDPAQILEFHLPPRHRQSL